MNNIRLTTVLLTMGLLISCSPRNHETGGLGIADRYIVVLKKEPVQSAMQSANLGLAQKVEIKEVVSGLMLGMASDHQIEPAERIFSVVFQGGVYHLDKDQAERLALDPRVAYVEKDQLMHINSVQANATWGLDRLDQSSLPLDHSYNYPAAGASVNAYIIDTGILATHQEFQGRASGAIDFVDSGGSAVDCNGHGTHVAGTIGSATYGVAKNVNLFAVRVLDCAGSGSIADVVSGIEWVTAHHVKPAVANMSLGGGSSQAIDDAIKASVQAGVTFVVAAGNENTSACNGSPARVPEAITVASMTNADARSSFSNYGNCVDVFAPGSDITSTWIGSNTATNTISGTSMASPHVAGVVALYLSQHPQALPAEVSAQLVASATSGRISSPGSGSPNLLVNTAFLLGGGGGGTPDPILQNGKSVDGISDAKDGEKFFTIEVPANSGKLTLEMSGGSGDADLYLKFAAKPSSASYDCRPYLGGNSESCVIASPQSGTWYVSIKGYSAYAGVSLKATIEPASGNGGDPCTACSHLTDSLSAKGVSVIKPDSNGYQSAAGLHQFWLKGPANSDFDLYLYKKSGTSWVQVAKATSGSSSETMSYQGTAGTYRLKVISFSGSGSFDLWQKLP